MTKLLPEFFNKIDLIFGSLMMILNLYRRRAGFGLNFHIWKLYLEEGERGRTNSFYLFGRLEIGMDYD